MGKINWYTTRSLFKGDPKNLTELRDAQHLKLKQDKPGGSFIFTMEADDDQPALVVSWTGDAEKKDYWKTVVKAKEAIKGKFTSEVKSKLSNYTFTIDDSDKASKELFKKYKALKNNALSIALWNLVGPQASTITFGGERMQKRSIGDYSWVLAKWDISKVLVTDEAFFDGPAPLREAELITEGKKQIYRLPNGLTFPADLAITVTVEGKIVEEAFDQKTKVEGSSKEQKNADILREKVADVFRPLLWKMAEDMLKCDEDLAKEKKTAKKQKLVDALDDTYEKFLKKAEDAIIESAEKQWMLILNARQDYHDFEVDTAVTIVKGSITLTLGIAGAVVGGVTAVGAILGLVGTIKGGIELVSSMYTAFRDTETMGNEINASLAKALEEKYAAGWRDFGKTVLGNLPGGPAVQQVLSKFKVSVKPVKTIKSEIKTYNGKVSKLVSDSDKLRKQVAGVLKQSEEAIAALKTSAVKALEEKDPELKKRNKELRKKIGEDTTKFLDSVGDIYQKFTAGKAKVDELEKLVKLLEEEVEKDILATTLRDVFVPLLNLPWGIDPDHLATTIMAMGSVTVDVVTPLVSELTKEAEASEEASGWIRQLNDTATGIAVLITAVKEAKG